MATPIRHLLFACATCATCAIIVASTASCRKKMPQGADVKDNWDAKNDPAQFDPRFSYTFASLPLSGRTDKIPWSDTYWPENKGGIGFRWVYGRPNRDVWSYTPPTEAQVKEMSLKDLMYLSAAEKYDVYMGRFDYPTVDYARRRNHKTEANGKPTPKWKGVCHAWAAVSLYYQEPKEIMLQSAQGIWVPFGSSDVKALLIAARDLTGNLNPRYSGYRCNEAKPTFNSLSSKQPCNGLNAGAFHVLMANLLQPGKQGFIMDVDAAKEIWNQPVYSFQSQVLSERDEATTGAAPGTVREVHIKSAVTYIAELEPNWYPHITRKTNFSKTATYLYRLELDDRGRIIGGMWESKERPDFAWMQDKPDLSGDITEMWYDSETKIEGLKKISLDGIRGIYQQSIK
jgi:hypothetical protein